jgi:hypothetical protein
MTTPSFSQRVQQTSNGGFMLSHVTKSDAGNYSVELNGQDSSGQFMTQCKTVVLVVDGKTLH